MIAALAFLKAVPGKVWVYGATAILVLLAIHSYGDMRQDKGEATVRAQWETALKAQLKKTAEAQSDLSISAQKSDQKRVEKTATIKKIVADYSEQAHDITDEKALYFSARAAIFRVRDASGLPSADCSPNPA